MQVEYVKWSETFTQQFCGAGVILYCVRQGEVYYLLARESRYPSWRSSYKWSGFEGRKSEIDSCPEDNANREFQEESMGIIFEDITSLLREKKYTMRVVMTVDNTEKHHFTYLIPIDHSDTIPIIFSHCRNAILSCTKETRDELSHILPSLSHIFHSSQEKRIHYLEKCELKWWSSTKMTHVLSNSGNYKNHKFRPYFLPVMQEILKQEEVLKKKCREYASNLSQ